MPDAWGGFDEGFWAGFLARFRGWGFAPGDPLYPLCELAIEGMMKLGSNASCLCVLWSDPILCD